jgi:hypothetical protein
VKEKYNSKLGKLFSQSQIFKCFGTALSHIQYHKTFSPKILKDGLIKLLDSVRVDCLQQVDLLSENKGNFTELVKLLKIDEIGPELVLSFVMGETILKRNL